MSLIAINAPDQDVNGITTKWRAAFHPVIFELRRQDQAVQLKQKPPVDPSYVQLVMFGAIPSEVAAGQKVMYIQPNGEIYIWTIGAVTSNVIYTSDGTISGTVVGGSVIYLDAFPKYYVEADIMAIDTSNSYVKIGTLRKKSDVNGIISINVMEWLQSQCTQENDFNYNVINKAMIGEGGRYSVVFREYNSPAFNGVNQQPFSIRYFTNSARQIQDKFGASMAEHVPTYDASRDPQAKFLSVFNKPTYFVGYPFSLNFIYSENLTNRQITREEEQFDLNGGTVSTSSANLDMTQRFFNNRLMIEQDYPSNVKEIDVWLEAGLPKTKGVWFQSDWSLTDFNEPPSPSEPPIKAPNPTK